MTERPGPQDRGRRPQREQSSSHRLNVAFTTALQAYDRKITPELLHGEVAEPRFIRIVTKEEDRSDFTDRHPEIYRRSPVVLSLVGSKILVPVGDYGEEWAKKIVIGAQRMREAATSPDSPANVLEDIERVTAEDEEVIRRHTYQATQYYAELPEGVKRTFYEGGESEGQAAAFLTQYKVEGYDDPEELYHDLIRDGVVSQFSLTIPRTVTAQMATQWVSLTPSVVEKGEDGRLRLNPQKIAHWIEHRGEYPETVGGEEPLDKPGCPVGRNLPGEALSGVDLGAKHLLEYIQGERVQIRERSTAKDREQANDKPETSGLATPRTQIDVPVEKAQSSDILEFGAITQSNQAENSLQETKENEPPSQSGVVFDNGEGDRVPLDELDHDEQGVDEPVWER